MPGNFTITDPNGGLFGCLSQDPTVIDQNIATQAELDKAAAHFNMTVTQNCADMPQRFLHQFQLCYQYQPAGPGSGLGHSSSKGLLNTNFSVDWIRDFDTMLCGYDEARRAEIMKWIGVAFGIAIFLGFIIMMMVFMCPRPSCDNGFFSRRTRDPAARAMVEESPDVSANDTEELIDENEIALRNI